MITTLGILAAIVVFAVNGIGDKGSANAAKTDAQVLRTAEEAYFAKNGHHGSLTELSEQRIPREQPDVQRRHPVVRRDHVRGGFDLLRQRLGRHPPARRH